ncbi:helix-turn-helix domain-containing protein [Bordetella bronchialis]|uniref:helix-turn-helix domain-containing protein n=1 Tax=Bordetella bronchialis TaxID=463025 RepID=UPI003CFCB4DB
MTPIQRAIAIVGSASALARILGISVQAVCNYRDGREIDAAHCPTIERETRERGETVRCEELRPDVDWEELRRSGAVNQQEAANA